MKHVVWWCCGRREADVIYMHIISKNVIHFGGLKGLLLKIEACRCYFNLCKNILLAISNNPTATIHVLWDKTQQLEVLKPSVVSSNSSEMLRGLKEIKWESWSWASSAVCFTEVEGEMHSSPLKTAMMMNGTLPDQLNSLLLWRKGVLCPHPEM